MLAAAAMASPRPRRVAARAGVTVAAFVHRAFWRTDGGDGSAESYIGPVLEALMDEQSVFTYEFEGVRYDAGTTMGWLQATVELALQRQDLGSDFRAYLRSLDSDG